MSDFNDSEILSYLGLTTNYTPSPKRLPIEFLTKHLKQLPPQHLTKFSAITNPRERTTIPAIRNRRLKYAQSAPRELSFVAARSRWPMLWEGRERRGLEEGMDEKEWAETGFLEGSRKHVGKLGNLLGEYEEEREAERVRTLRRERGAESAFVPEEDSDSEDEDVDTNIIEEEPTEQAEAYFERRIRERFIYGLLESIDYDAVDWDDQFDADDDREAEDRWFEEEEEDM